MRGTILQILRHDYVMRAPLALFLYALFYVGAFGVFKIAKQISSTGVVDNILPLASSLANCVFIMTLLVLTVIRSKPLQTSTGILPRLSAIGGSFLGLSFFFLPPADLPPFLSALATVMTLAGSLLSLWTVTRLGRSFSIVAEARRLVTDGPYAVVRHPLYLCEEIGILGVALSFASPAAVAIAVIHWCFQLDRMKREEKVLRAVFPEYEAYAAAVPRILPWRRRYSAVSTTADERP